MSPFCRTQSSSKDAELLYNALDCRLSDLKAAGGEGGQAEAEAAAKKARSQEEAGAQG